MSVRRRYKVIVSVGRLRSLLIYFSLSRFFGGGGHFSSICCPTRVWYLFVPGVYTGYTFVRLHIVGGLTLDGHRTETM